MRIKLQGVLGGEVDGRQNLWRVQRFFLFSGKYIPRANLEWNELQDSPYRFHTLDHSHITSLIY